MAISLVGSTTQDPTAAVTTLSSAMPAGVAAGDLVVFVALTNTITIPAAPSGYTQITTSANSTIGLGVWYKFAASSSEPAPSTTQSVFRASSATLVYRGVDPTTPIDVAAGTSTAGTTAVAVPARTPLTAGAWPIAIGSMLTTSTNVTTWGSTNLVLDQPSISNVAGSNNPAFVVGHFVWSTGAFTPVVTKSATSTRTIGTHFVLRAAATSTSYAAAGTSAATTAATGLAAAILVAAGTAAAVTGATGSAALVPRTFAADGTASVVSGTTGATTSRLASSSTAPATTTASGAGTGVLVAAGSSAATTTTSGSTTSRLPASGAAPVVSSASGSATVIGGAQSYPASGVASAVTTASGSSAARLAALGSSVATTATSGSTSSRLRAVGSVPLVTTTAGSVGVTYVVGGSSAALSGTAGGATASLTATGSTAATSGSTGEADVITAPPPSGFRGRILAVALTTPQVDAELVIDTASGHLSATSARARITIPTATGDIA